MSSLKEQVHDYWNEEPCGTGLVTEKKYSPEYFEQLRRTRYEREPEIMEFADFVRGRGKRVLEVGVGAGTDFAEWCRSGAEAHGVDLTEEGIAHTKTRLDAEQLSAASLRVGDAESLPHPDNHFDIVYSWGVIHHSPDTPRALGELIRVAKPGGTIKLMVYHLDSPVSWVKWALHGMWRGKGRRWALAHHLESPGTKAYTYEEIRRMCTVHPVHIKSLRAPLTYYDYLKVRGRAAQFFGHVLCGLLDSEHSGFFLQLELRKN
ncbi:MAG: class I SAM-dependent methyltransferase [Gemmatimonadaceae bacterium]